MDYTEQADPTTHDLLAHMRISQSELATMQSSIQTFLVRRLVDTLYAELLPVMRERVGKSLDALAIARCIEGEIANAVHDAFGGK